MQQILKRRHLVTRRNMGCFQGLAILIVVCTVIICALQILCFFLSKKTRNVSSSMINEDLNGHNREPGNPRKINIQWPHLNRRKQPIEHSEQLFNQVGFMTITYCEQLLRQLVTIHFLFPVYGLICTRVGCSENMGTMSDVIFYSNIMRKQILKLKVYVNLFN